MNGYRLLFFLMEAYAFLGCATFVVRYHILTRGAWRRDEAGVMLMMVYSDLAALLLWLMFAPMLSRWALYRPVTIILFALFSIFAWWPLRMLMISQKKIHEAVVND